MLLEDAACRDDPERRRKAMARIRELNKLAGFPMKVRLSPLDASQLPAELPDILASLSSEDPEARLSGVRLLRRHLCVGLLNRHSSFSHSSLLLCHCKRLCVCAHNRGGTV